jgi:three-Cys-motif partner protein
MTKKTFFETPFDEGTKSKLEIFKEYFKESFPVFLHSQYFQEIIIIDFFAGQGTNEFGEYGTSVNILNEIKPHCNDLRRIDKKVTIIFNDKNQSKALSNNIDEFLTNCRHECNDKCNFEIEKNILIRDQDFLEYFNKIYPTIKSKKNAAFLLFFDPYNFIMNEDIFYKLIDLRNAEFICFLPTSYLYRFKEVGGFSKYLKDFKISFEETNIQKCHRTIVDHLKQRIPAGKEYYLGSFTIKKNASSHYGLIFGTNHSFGAEKFQKVCWNIDESVGEANFNIDNELAYNQDQMILFDEYKVSSKLKNFKSTLREKILNQEIKTDKDVYKWALTERCLVKHAAEVLKELMVEGKINKFKTRNSEIHRIKEPINIFVK